jgi:hypothetical protein
LLGQNFTGARRSVSPEMTAGRDRYRSHIRDSLKRPSAHHPLCKAGGRYGLMASPVVAVRIRRFPFRFGGGGNLCGGKPGIDASTISPACSASRRPLRRGIDGDGLCR